MIQNYKFHYDVNCINVVWILEYRNVIAPKLFVGGGGGGAEQNMEGPKYFYLPRGLKILAIALRGLI